MTHVINILSYYLMPINLVMKDVTSLCCSHRRTGQHPFGGADRVLPEWIQWGGGVVAENFRDPYSVGRGGGSVAEIFRDPCYLGCLNFVR